MDANTLYHRSVEYYAGAVNEVGAEQWSDPTPCAGWTVRDLVNHVTVEDRWTAPLMGGATIEEIGDQFEGDLLGDEPIATALTAAREAVDVVAKQLPRTSTVHLSFGETPAEEYVRQLAADHLVHGWDLAVAIDGDTRMDPHLVHEVADWFAEREELYRAAEVIAARQPLDGTAQHDLLARFGRDPRWGRQHRTLVRFGAAFAAGDLEAALALVTDDIVFESTSPGPDGQRHQGREQVRAAWSTVLATPDMVWTEEESLVVADRAVVRWRYEWGGDQPGHVRGVDVIRFRDGLVCEKLSYVKG